jgi:hypothetical protein
MPSVITLLPGLWLSFQGDALQRLLNRLHLVLCGEAQFGGSINSPSFLAKRGFSDHGWRQTEHVTG